MNKKELLAYLTAGASGSNPYAEGAERMKLEKYLKGSVGPDGQYQPGAESLQKKQELSDLNEQNLRTLQDPNLQGMLRQGGSVKVGDIALGADPSARLAAQGPHEAQTFLKNAQTAYKGINDQLDASRATIEALNHNDAASDKLALINEARLAAGAGGSRAIKGIMDSLTGGKTAAMDLQSAINYFQNTPNIPTLQPGQRNAIRESVFNRIPQIEDMHNQATASLAQQGPAIAPHADYNTILQSFVSPAQQRLQGLKKMQAEYAEQRQYMQPQPNVSAPSVADPNPTTLDKLKSFFGLGGGAQAQPAPQSPSPGSQQASGVSAPHPQDNVALSWARLNPNDPRAAKILQMNGVQ